VRIGLAQANSFLGDFANNRKKAEDFVKQSLERGCELVVFPEAFLFGYHPVDLLERTKSVDAQMTELKKLYRSIPKGITVIMGVINPSQYKTGKPFQNSAAILEKGKAIRFCSKELLPTYDVFDEGRHIEPGEMVKNFIKVKGKRILVTICEDIWAWPNNLHGKRNPYRRNPLKAIKPKGIDLVVNLSASPFCHGKYEMRLKVCRETTKHFHCPIVYCNMVGAQDEIVFDGGSLVLDSKGKLVAKAEHFVEDILIYDIDENLGHVKSTVKEKYERARLALALGIRDFVYKTGFKRVHLGLSGGIDSALVACLAADALGPQNVTCVALPGPYSSDLSLNLAKQLTSNLGAQWLDVNIVDTYDVLLKELSSKFGSFDFGIANENMQARLRGVSLMSYSNLNKDSLLLNTSNKSELATGYSTLYGDQVGGLSVIGDLLKTQVYELAKHYNREYELIPQQIILRAPSAELRSNQKDSDSLLPYDELDPIVERLVEKLLPPRNEQEKKVLLQLMHSEFKRWQAPPILKVSKHAFGRGRRLPVANRSLF